MPITIAAHNHGKYSCVTLFSEDIKKAVDTLLDSWRSCGYMAIEKGNLATLDTYAVYSRVAEGNRRGSARRYNSFDEMCKDENNILLGKNSDWYVVIEKRLVDAQFIRSKDKSQCR